MQDTSAHEVDALTTRPPWQCIHAALDLLQTFIFVRRACGKELNKCKPYARNISF